jgi:hypothetical protein
MQSGCHDRRRCNSDRRSVWLALCRIAWMATMKPRESTRTNQWRYDILGFLVGCAIVTLVFTLLVVVAVHWPWTS